MTNFSNTAKQSTKFHENLFSGLHVVYMLTDGRTARHTGTAKQRSVSLILSLAKVPKNRVFV